MEQPDGTSIRFDDGTVACTGRREVRDGARVALLTVPGLLRVDLRCVSDTFDIGLRHLAGHELATPLLESELRGVELPDGTLRNEYQYLIDLRDGPSIRVVAWLKPFQGELVREHAAVALITER